MAQKHNSYEEKPMTRFGSVQGPSRRYRRLRHPTFPAAEWADKNPLLQRGEIGYEVDTHHVKVGDGITYWNDLPYIFDDAGQPLSTADYQMGNAQGGWTTMSQAQQDALNSGATTAKINQIATNTTNISNHIADTNNPHSVTKAQVGLGNVDNTSDLDKPISTATQTALDGKQATISDLSSIRSGAALGATAVQPGDLATVATTGDYDDLLNKPTIPTVNDATLTIQKNGTTVNTFTANASSNVTANITVPTDTNDLTNGAGYITGIDSTDVTNALGYTPVDPSSLATVATTGDYDDLLNKPTIPAAQVNSDWNANSGVAEILNKPTLGTMAAEDASDYTPTASLAPVALSGAYSDLSGTPSLATVATSGSYNDLLNKPTIPTVNDATLTIQKNGTNVATFTANASSAVTANISVPTDTNDLTNGAGYITGITSSDVTSALGYTPYSDANPNGYTSNVGTVTSVNSVSPDSSGNVSLTIPTVNDATITITQGGVTKGSFTLNQASGDTIALDAGGGSVDIDNLTITKNGDDELQAVATVNTNTAAGATNPIYDWVGTLAEYNNGVPVYCWVYDFMKVYTTTETPTTSDIGFFNIPSARFTITAVGTNTITAGGFTYTRDSTYDTYWAIEDVYPDWLCFITDDDTFQAYDAYSKSQSDTLLALKANTNFSNTTMIDYVVEKQDPSALNNYTWYRKYNSGWVEQGGVTPTAIDGTAARQTVTMPVEMSDANYTVYVTITRPNDPDFRDQFLVAGLRTETNFVIYSNWAGSGNGTKSNRGTWLVMGMAA